MKIGDVVQIEKRPGAWVVAERVVSGSRRAKYSAFKT